MPKSLSNMNVTKEAKTLMISDLEGPFKWIKEGKVEMSKIFCMYEWDTTDLLDFTDLFSPIYRIAKKSIEAYILAEGYKGNEEENGGKLTELVSVLDIIKDKLQME